MSRMRQPVMSIVKRTTTWLAIMVAAATMTTVVAASPSFAAGAPGTPKRRSLKVGALSSRTPN
jgi:hypothetical protein